MNRLLCFATFLTVLSTGLAASCSNPEVVSKSFTTQDATIVSNIAFISDFSVKCQSGSLSNLYAYLDGSIVPVAVTGQNTFQISWTEETKAASRGDKVIKVYDEDGYTAVRKALRAGEDVSSTEPLFQVTVNYPGAYNGPWLKSELLAVIVSLAVAYVAIASKQKVVS